MHKFCQFLNNPHLQNIPNYYRTNSHPFPYCLVLYNDFDLINSVSKQFVPSSSSLSSVYIRAISTHRSIYTLTTNSFSSPLPLSQEVKLKNPLVCSKWKLSTTHMYLLCSVHPEIAIVHFAFAFWLTHSSNSCHTSSFHITAHWQM